MLLCVDLVYILGSFITPYPVSVVGPWWVRGGITLVGPWWDYLGYGIGYLSDSPFIEILLFKDGPSRLNYQEISMTYKIAL